MSISAKSRSPLIKKDFRTSVCTLEQEFLRLNSYCGSIDKTQLEKELVKAEADLLCSNEYSQSLCDYLYWQYAAFVLDKEKSGHYFSNIDKAIESFSLNAFNSLSKKKYSSFEKILNEKNNNLLQDTLLTLCNNFLKSEEDALCVPAFIPEFVMYYLDRFSVGKEYELGDLESTVDEFLSNSSVFEFDAAGDGASLSFESTTLYHEIQRNSFEHSFNELNPELAYEEHSSVIKGMPGSVAFKIGLNYLNGSILPLNKQSAKEWFSYGMSVGNPYCMLAYALYFSDIDCKGEENRNNKFADFFTLLFNSLYLCCCKNSYHNKFVFNFEITKDEEGRRFDEVCLYNVLNCYCTITTDLSITPENPLAISLDDTFVFQNILIKAQKSQKNSAWANALCVLYIILCEFEGMIDEFVSDFKKSAGLVSRGKKDTYSFCLNLLSEGLKEKKEYSYNVFILLFSSRKGSLDEMPKNHLKVLKEMGSAKAAFILGNLGLSNPKSNENDVFSNWAVSADNGMGFAYFNLSLAQLMKQNFEEAAKLAFKAIQYDVVYAYFVLYRAYLIIDEQLAHTYLRIASEYMFPEAIKEYKALKASGKYKPLPYMRCLEEIEEMAKTNYHAALFMCDVYTCGSLLPVNLEKTYFYQRMSLVNGCYDLFHIYKNINRISFPPVIDKEGLFLNYRQSLNNAKAFFKTSPDDEKNNPPEIVFEKSFELVRELCKGKSDFEKDVMSNLYNSSMWNRFREKNLRIPKKLTGKLFRSAVCELSDSLSRGDYNSKFGCSVLEILENAANSISCLSGMSKERSLILDEVRTLLCIRSLSSKTDYQMFKKNVCYSTNSGSVLGTLLDSVDFSFVFENVSSSYAENQISLYGDEFGSDVMISTVSQ